MSFVEPGIGREIVSQFGGSGIRQAVESATGGILFGVLLGTPHTASERPSRLPGLTFETDLYQKSFVVVGAALTLDAVDRRACAGCLEPLLQCRFVVAQRIAGAQIECKPLGGLTENLAVDKGAHGVETAVEEDRTHHSFHRI